MVNYLSIEYATNQAIAEYGADVLRYTQSANITSQQFADNLVTNTCQVADVYIERTLYAVFIESVDASVCYTLLHYWKQKPQEELTDIAFHAESFLSVQNGTGKALNNNQGNYTKCSPTV